MIPILLESALFVALIVTAGALLLYLIYHFTPVGVWIRQGQNRRRIDATVVLECPRHGAHAPEQLVRLPDGNRVCPQCYEEIVHGHD